MLFGWGSATLGAVLITLSILMLLKNRGPTIRTWFVFLGILLIGITGPVLGLLGQVVAKALGLADLAASRWLGLSAGTGLIVITVALGYLLIHDWAPKHKASKSTYFIAVTLAIMISAGITPFAALNQLPSTVQQTTLTGG